MSVFSDISVLAVGCDISASFILLCDTNINLHLGVSWQLWSETATLQT